MPKHLVELRPTPKLVLGLVNFQLFLLILLLFLLAWEIVLPTKILRVLVKLNLESIQFVAIGNLSSCVPFNHIINKLQL